ncbi:hypothetical protein D3C72_1677010 [compost metagenome]
MQASTGKPGQTGQVGNLQRVSGVLLDVGVEAGKGQLLLYGDRVWCVAQAGQQQHCALLGYQRVVHRAGRQPVDQLLLVVVQHQRPAVLQQPLAGCGLFAQAAFEPGVTRYIKDQAMAASGTAAGMVGTTRHHDQTLTLDPCAATVKFEVQLPAQAEHQLRMLMAVGDQVVCVVTQGENRAAAHCRVLQAVAAVYRVRQGAGGVIRSTCFRHVGFIARWHARQNCPGASP